MKIKYITFDIGINNLVRSKIKKKKYLNMAKSDERGKENSLRPYQLVQVLPKVLRHEAEESQESPAKTVKAGVVIIWIATSLHACVAFRTATEAKKCTQPIMTILWISIQRLSRKNHSELLLLFLMLFKHMNAQRCLPSTVASFFMFCLFK